MKLSKNIARYNAAIYDENENLKGNYYIKEFNENTIDQLVHNLEEGCIVELSKNKVPHPGDFEDVKPGDLYVDDSAFFKEYNSIYENVVGELKNKLKEINLNFYLADKNGVVFNYTASLEDFSILRIFKNVEPTCYEVFKLKITNENINILEKDVNPYNMIYIGSLRKVFKFLENKIRLFASLND